LEDEELYPLQGYVKRKYLKCMQSGGLQDIQRGGLDAYKGPRKRRDIVWTPFFCGNGCRGKVPIQFTLV